MRTAKAMMHDMFIIRLYKQIEKQVRLFFYLVNLLLSIDLFKRRKITM
jgi:hypothetical protein